MLSIDHFSHVRDERLRTLVEHWLNVRAGRRMPRRRDIDPGAIKRVLPYIAIFQHLADEGTFFCRLAGEEINRFNGKPWHGHRFDEFEPTPSRQQYKAALSSVIDSSVVLHGIGRFLFDAHWIDGESIMLPLAEDGEHPDAVLHCLVHQARIYGGNRTSPSGLDLIDTKTPLVPAPGSSDIQSSQEIIRVQEGEPNPSLIL